MKYLIDLGSSKITYMQLYEQLRADIINSVYKYGDKLPSKRFLDFSSNFTDCHAAHNGDKHIRQSVTDDNINLHQ